MADEIKIGLSPKISRFLGPNFLLFLPVLGGEFFIVSSRSWRRIFCFFFKFKLDHCAIHEEGLVFPVQAFDVSSKTLQDVSRRLKKICFNGFLQRAIFSSFVLHHHPIHKVELVFPVEYFDVSSKTFQDVSRHFKTFQDVSRKLLFWITIYLNIYRYTKMVCILSKPKLFTSRINGFFRLFQLFSLA